MIKYPGKWRKVRWQAYKDHLWDCFWISQEVQNFLLNNDEKMVLPGLILEINLSSSFLAKFGPSSHSRIICCRHEIHLVLILPNGWVCCVYTVYVEALSGASNISFVLWERFQLLMSSYTCTGTLTFMPIGRNNSLIELDGSHWCHQIQLYLSGRTQIKSPEIGGYPASAWTHWMEGRLPHLWIINFTDKLLLLLRVPWMISALL